MSLLKTTVIKLGGSLLFSPQLRTWLQCIAAASKKTNMLIVPGGGCFANQVRNAQDYWGFSDDVAHDMAILAMQQFAYLLLSLQPRLQPLADWRSCLNDTPQPQAHVLLPQCLLTGCDLKKSWQVSADTLSLWLADKLQAERLYLVKSVALTPGQQHADLLAKTGLLDQYFPSLLQETSIPVSWCFAKDYVDFPTSTAYFDVLR